MIKSSRSKQRGISLLGMLFVGGVLAVTGVVMLQVAPTLIELQAITKAVNKARDGGTPVEARAIFDRAAAIDDIKSISGRDLVVKQDSGHMVVSFAYEREIHLFGPAYLTLKYAGRSK